MAPDDSAQKPPFNVSDFSLNSTKSSTIFQLINATATTGHFQNHLDWTFGCVQQLPVVTVEARGVNADPLPMVD